MAETPSRSSQTFERPATGAFSAALYRDILQRVHEQNAVLTLTVSNGSDERVVFFTRGAILFLAIGATGGEVLARKLVARGHLPEDKVEELVRRANADTPLLQDILLSERILEPDVVKSLVEEVLEDQLVGMAYWEGLYDLNPGNPPPRLYAKDVPAVRLSLGTKALLARVRPRVADAPGVLSTLMGSVRNTVKRAGASAPGRLAPDDAKVLAIVRDGPRVIRDVLDEAARQRLAVPIAAAALAALVRNNVLVVERASTLHAQAEDRAQAKLIEGSFDNFVNALLARTHLAHIYERVGEQDKAADQYRGIADEQLARNNLDEGLAALHQVVRFRPQDLEARELLVKVLQGADRLAEAAREAVDLGRLFLQVGLPGRARAALELSLKLVPGSLNVLWMLGGLLEQLGYGDDAIRVLDEVAWRSKEAGDEPSVIAAYQRILDIDPRNSKALAVLRRYGGYGRAVAARYTTAVVSVLVALLLIAYLGYQALALEAYKKVRDEKVWPAADSGKFDVAREAAQGYLRQWDLSWAGGRARALLERIDDEEDSVREQGFAAAVREAQKLDRENQVPAALDLWRRARETKDAERQRVVEAAIGKDEARVKTAEDALSEARKLAATPDRVHQLLVQAINEAPWLASRKDLMLPCRIDSNPRGARVSLDGVACKEPTPVVVDKKPAAVTLLLEARGREPWKLALDPLPPWPVTVLLPLKAAWRAPVASPGEPLLVGDVVLCAGTGRRVTALARQDGLERWTHSLGVFGESELPLALMGDAVVVRTGGGDVVALELATGVERWRQAVASPPLDLSDPAAARPIGCPQGVLVREGTRGLAFLAPRDGSKLWSFAARSDLVGAPTISGDLAAASLERSLQAWRLSDGASPWAVRLPRPAITAPVPAPGGGFALAVEPDDVLRVDHEGTIVATEREVTHARASTPLWGDARGTLVGTTSGEVVSLDATGKVAWRATTEADHAVRWVRGVDADLSLAGDESVLYAFDAKGQELWRHPCQGASRAVGDETRVYQGGVRGVEAFER